MPGNRWQLDHGRYNRIEQSSQLVSLQLLFAVDTADCFSDCRVQLLRSLAQLSDLKLAELVACNSVCHEYYLQL